MSTMRASVLLWAQRMLALRGGPPHVLLEVAENATAQQIQEAFHKIARTSHPDLFRHGLDAQELELVTSAYAVVAGAYQQMRSICMQSQRMRAIKPEEPMAIEPPAGDGARGTGQTAPIPRVAEPAGTGQTSPIPRVPPPAGQTSQIPRVAQPASTGQTSPISRVGQPTPPGGARTVPAPPSDVATPSGPAQSMSPKAVHYYRKAELCLKRGDLRGAILQLKLACAIDPTSSFLRTALAEVETEVRNKG